MHEQLNVPAWSVANSETHLSNGTLCGVIKHIEKSTDYYCYCERVSESERWHFLLLLPLHVISIFDVIANIHGTENSIF